MCTMCKLGKGRRLSEFKLAEVTGGWERDLSNCWRLMLLKRHHEPCTVAVGRAAEGKASSPGGSRL